VKDLAQDVAQDVLGAAKDGNVKVFILKVLVLPIAICQVVKVFILSSASGGNHSTPALRWHVKDEHGRDEHVKDAAQEMAEDVTQDVAKDLLGAAEGGQIVICQRQNPRHACP